MSPLLSCSNFKSLVKFIFINSGKEQVLCLTVKRLTMASIISLFNFMFIIVLKVRKVNPM